MVKDASPKQTAAGSRQREQAGVANNKMYAAGSDRLRVGIIGCGDRGTYDATNCVKAAGGVEIVALADLFEDRIESCLRHLKQNLADLPESVKVTPESCFTGFDAYHKLLACDIDVVMLTETPHFRPAHLRAAVEAGKHVFMEKPAAVDPVGVRSVLESAQLADEKALTIVAGTQMRRIAHIVELMRRIHRGDIGRIVGGHCVRTEGGMLNWGPPPQPGWSDMELQIRRWLFYVWTSGDLIVEQQVHNLDLMNWAVGDHPVSCLGRGGRQARTAPQFGNVYDHFAVEYEYPGGLRIEYIGGQIDGWTYRNNQVLFGTRGTACFDFGNAVIEGDNAFKYDRPIPNPCVIQHAEHIAAIRNGRHRNEARRLAESTLTAIMGRMSAYTGRALSWDWVMNSSQLRLGPDEYKLGPLPAEPVAIPGRTQLI